MGRNGPQSSQTIFSSPLKSKELLFTEGLLCAVLDW